MMCHIVTLGFFITQLALSIFKKRDANKIKKSNRRMKVERMIHPFDDFQFCGGTLYLKMIGFLPNLIYNNAAF